MNTDIPIIRHPFIKPISREHHHALLLCWKIKTGLSKGVALYRIKKYTDWFFKYHLEPHFSLEEKVLFPILGGKNELVMQAMREHRVLAMLFAETDAAEATLKKIEGTLKKHIRFEERVLFNEIQNKATEKQLHKLSQIHSEDKFIDNTEDIFWE
jgi:iron-sulfur cluster repair protein YtfE (RIC family)